MLGGLSRPLPSILTSYSASPKLITLPSPSRYDTPGMSFAPCIVVPVALLASVRKNLPARHASVAWRASSPAAAGSATSASSAEPPSTTSFSAVAPTAEPPPTSGTSTTTSSPVQLTCPSGGAVPAQMTRKTHAQGGRRGAETLSASHTRQDSGTPCADFDAMVSSLASFGGVGLGHLALRLSNATRGAPAGGDATRKGVRGAQRDAQAAKLIYSRAHGQELPPQPTRCACTATDDAAACVRKRSSVRYTRGRIAARGHVPPPAGCSVSAAARGAARRTRARGGPAAGVTAVRGWVGARCMARGAGVLGLRRVLFCGRSVILLRSIWRRLTSCMGGAGVNARDDGGRRGCAPPCISDRRAYGAAERAPDWLRVAAYNLSMASAPHINYQLAGTTLLPELLGRFLAFLALWKSSAYSSLASAR